MLPKKIRLTTSLFDQVFKTGKVQHGSHFWIRSVSLPAGLPSRFAVAVSKKAAKTAVSRNKIKRLVYRAIEELGVGISPNQMVIFGVKNDISLVHNSEIIKELQDLLLKKAQK
jgi:ribonuclease P protein component